MQLLLEVLTDEIPAGDQLDARLSLANIAKKLFTEIGIAFGGVDVFATPRRLVLLCSNVSSLAILPSKISRGPAKTAPQKALDGFLAANKITLSQTYEQDGYIYYKCPEQSIDAKKALEAILPKALEELSLSWLKSMPFNQSKKLWIRPVRSILCLFGTPECSDILAFSFAGIEASNKTSGNRFYAPEVFEVKNFDDYKQKLQNAFVTLSHEARIANIKEQIAKIEAIYGIKYDGDEALIAENAMLCEWVRLLPLQLGDIKALNVPDELIVETVKKNQRYLIFKNQDGTISGTCCIVSNNPFDKEMTNSNITSGNLKVLNARLKDAKFFVEQDLTINLKDRAEDLKKIQFIQGYGSVFDRTQRMLLLAKHFNALANLDIDEAKLERLFAMLKSDLTTQSVKEFDCLQGIIGAFIAGLQGEDAGMQEAIKTQYNQAVLQHNNLAMLAKLCDNLDKIYCYFASGSLPTSSKDPFALKRAANVVVAILLEAKLGLSLQDLILACKSIFKDVPLVMPEDFDANLYQFFYERFAFYFKQSGALPEVQTPLLRLCLCGTGASLVFWRDFIDKIYAGQVVLPQQQQIVPAIKRGLSLLKSKGHEAVLAHGAIYKDAISHFADSAKLNNAFAGHVPAALLFDALLGFLNASALCDIRLSYAKFAVKKDAIKKDDFAYLVPNSSGFGLLGVKQEFASVLLPAELSLRTFFAKNEWQQHFATLATSLNLFLDEVHIDTLESQELKDSCIQLLHFTCIPFVVLV